jgi:hypothetical protein
MTLTSVKDTRVFVYLALYSLLKGLCLCGVSVTVALALFRPSFTSLINWRDWGESALIVMTFFPVL